LPSAFPFANSWRRSNSGSIFCCRRVVGYADGAGRRAKNLPLSQRRADAVVAALASEGVDPQKLVAVGRGNAAVIADERGNQRRLNRRVVFETPIEAEQAQ